MLRLPAAVAAGLLVLLGACSASDGRTLPPPKATVTTVAAPPTSGEVLDGSGTFTLTTPVAAAGGVLPARHTCTGEDVSPPLQWTDAPPAAALAIVVRDTTAAGFVHWVVTGIDPAVTGLGEGGVPEGAVEATNDFGTPGWSGPCPAAGSGAHTYSVVLHALPEPLTVEPGTPGEEAATMVEGASSARAELAVVVTG